MNASAVKNAPTLIVFVAAGVCAWPYLGEPSTSTPTPAATKAAAAAKAAKVTELPAGLLNPPLVPRPSRDPYRDPEAHRVEVRLKIANALSTLVAQTKKRAGVRRPGRRGPGRPLPPRPRKGTPPRWPSRKRRPPGRLIRAGLVLNATTVVDGRGFAVLNGKSYGLGEAVPIAGAKTACQLAEVRLNEVQLQYDGKRWPLGYKAARRRAELRRSPSTATKPRIHRAKLRVRRDDAPARAIERESPC